MADTYSTDFVMGVLEDLTVPRLGLLDRFFPMIQTEESEEIHFDKLDGAKKLAPFVSPVVQGKIVQEKGFTTNTFKPAYIKPKTVLDANRPLKRVAGEQIGGGLSAAQRADLILVTEMENHIQMIRNRLNWMAAEALRTGAVTISGDGYQTVSLAFGRTAGHTVTLTSTDVWTDAASTPLDDLQDWATLIAKNGGGDARTVLMDPDAWKAFRSHADVAGRLDLRKTIDTQGVLAGAVTDRGLVPRGEIDGFDIVVYQDWYQTDAGVVTPFLPSGTVIMVADSVEGVQAFGAIRDPKAGFMAMPYFPKVWYEEDPGRNILMTQSAPLVVPQRPDCTVGASVL